MPSLSTFLENPTVQYVIARLKEPSTWAGIAVFIGMFGLSADTVNRIVTNGPAMITAAATLIAIFAPSHKKTVVVNATSSITDDPNLSLPEPPAQVDPRTGV